MTPNHVDKYGKHRVHLVLYLVAGILLDRIVTLSAFHYEANPLVNAMGPLGWLLFTAGFLVAAVSTWYYFHVYRSRIASVVVAITAGLHGLVVLLNVFVIYYGG